MTLSWAQVYNWGDMFFKFFADQLLIFNGLKALAEFNLLLAYGKN